MTDYSRIRYLQVGQQTGTTDTPTAWLSIECQGEPVTPNFQQTKIEQVFQTTDGEQPVAALGPKTGTMSFTTLVRGNGTAGASDALQAFSTDKAEIEFLMNAACGFAGQKGTGDLVVTGSTATIVKKTDATYYDGTTGSQMASGIMLDAANPGTSFECREVAVASGANLTLDRALTAAPAIGAAEYIYASESWYIDADNPNHTHLYARTEGGSWRRDLLGCGVKFTLTAPAGGLLAMGWELSANDWADAAEGSLTHTAPSNVNGIVVAGSKLWLSTSATSTELIECNIDSGLNVQPKTATEGANGQAGWLTTYDGATFNGKIYYSETIMNNFQSTTTYDIGVQFGAHSSLATRANAMYVRIPKLDIIDAKIGIFNGVDVIEFTGKARRPATGKGSIRFHLFGSAT